MRDIQVIVSRIQAGLPITDEERKAVTEHLLEVNKKQAKFMPVLLSILIIVVLGLVIIRLLE